MTRSNTTVRFPHGGDLTAARQQYRGNILDLSVNINPLGPPPEVLEAACTALERAVEYPDPQCRALKEAIARRDGVNPAWVFCGNGASEVIVRLVRALQPKRALLTAPAFSEYERALRSVECEIAFDLLREEMSFAVEEKILTAITSETDVVFLCSPNNPTGQIVPRSLLAQILRRCTQTGSVLVVDECFLDLSTGGAGLVEWLQHPNLILLRAFTKSYAIPSLRLGYGLCKDVGLLRRMEAVGPYWNVSGPAQAAGIACCHCPDWPTQGRALIEQERPILARQLTELGCRVIPSQANYLLFRLPGVTDLQERLLQRGILIRSCGNYRGLGPDWYRVAVRTPVEHGVFLTMLRQSLQR